ncbi:MAG: hypothetical protein IPJ65_28085 [Archangiaceae bacterium]|nr:hypothetical protein [Archangiaceae bacterium]
MQFAPVPQGFEYQLLDSSGMLLGTASEGHNHLRPAARITTGLAPPGQKVSLGLRACATSDGTCCSTLTPLDVMVVSVCQSPVAPSSTNVVLSEYVTNGEGACPSPDCATMDTCQAGEAVEITNLSNCPVTLDGYHFAYRNSNASTASYRWMNFGSADVIPPRGVYVAIRNRQYAPACAAPLGAESNGLYGLKISRLSMQGPNLCSGWFNNTGGGMSELQISPGNISAPELLTFTPSATVARVNPYHPTTGSIPSCSSVGFNAVDSCGSVASGQQPTSVLSPNQLGRLWHPCDAVVNAAPACVRD